MVTISGLSISPNGQGVLLFGCDKESDSIYELVVVQFGTFIWKPIPQKFKYYWNIYYSTAILIPEEMTTCRTETLANNMMIYYLFTSLGISISAGVISSVLIFILCHVCNNRRKKFREEFVWNNIFNLRNNPISKFDTFSQKMFDDEIAMLTKIDIDQITKGNQIGNS